MIRWLRQAVPIVLLAAAVGCARRDAQPNPERADQLRSAESWLSEEPVGLLRDYVRIDTSAGQGERKGTEFLESFFECAGIETLIVCPAPQRCNLLARLPGRSRGGALLLLNHIDVAPAPFPEMWEEGGPFEGKIKLGYLYGRGAYDMKSLALAQALAMRRLKERGITPGSDVLFLAEADEEVGQRWGARWLLEHQPEWFRDVAWVLNEGGSNEMILREVRYWGIETVQAGYGLIELQASTAAELEAFSRRWPKAPGEPVAPHPDVVLGFDLLANHLSSPLTDPLRHLDRVRSNPAELAILPDRYGSFLEPRLQWSPPYAPRPDVPGGPSDFRIYVTISVPPGTSPVPFFERIRADAVRAGLRVIHSFLGETTSASPYREPDGSLVSFVDLLKRVTEAHHPGVPFGPVPTAGAYTTSAYFRNLGIPTYGYSPIPMNIFDSARRHAPNERIYLRDYLDGVELMSDVLEEFAIAPPRTPLSGEKRKGSPAALPLARRIVSGRPPGATPGQKGAVRRSSA